MLRSCIIVKTTWREELWIALVRNPSDSLLIMVNDIVHIEISESYGWKVSQ